MKIRSRIIITAALACHLLVAPRLVTSQLQPRGNLSLLPGAAAFRPPMPGEEVTIRAREQEKIGDLYRLRGEVEISFRTFVLRADEVTYQADTGEVGAKGHVTLDGGPNDEHIEADHGTYNINTNNGHFYKVRGTTGARMSGKEVVLTSSSPFFFTGDEIEIAGRDKITVHRGTITSCQLPNPKWQFRTSTAVVVAGEDAKVYNATFSLGGVPVFYFPYAQYSIDRLRRKSGFLLPKLGQSSKKGTILGEAFYWAINRSFDTTFGMEYFSRRGWAENISFRGVPSDSSYINFRSFSVQDRGVGTPPQDQGGTEAHLAAESPMPLGFRGVLNLNYLSSLIFRLGFAETFQQAINSEVESTAFLSQSRNGYSLNLMASRYQNFWSSTPGDVITVLHTPRFESSSVERPIGKSRVVWSYDASLEGISRREPSFSTSTLMARADLRPSIAVPWVWHGWGVRPELTVRDTFYSERLVPGEDQLGTAVPQSINRRALEANFEMRPPALSRIFGRTVLGRKIKHTIEPRMIYRYVNGVDNFAGIIRFDGRDVLSDTNEIEYGLVNRLYAKRAPGMDCKPLRPVHSVARQTQFPVLMESGTEEADGQDLDFPQLGSSGQESKTIADQTMVPDDDCSNPTSREIASWEVAQKHFFDPTFGGVLVNGRRNVLTSSVNFTGIAFLTEPRTFSPMISRLRIHASGRADMEWHFDYDPKKGRISASTTFINFRFLENLAFGAGHAFLQAPGEIITSTPLPSVPRFNQLRLILQYGTPWKRGFNTAVAAGYDANIRFLQYSAFQTTYNWDCCGVSFEYRRFALGQVRNENQFRFALSLTNVGTFGTLHRQERLF